MWTQCFHCTQGTRGSPTHTRGRSTRVPSHRLPRASRHPAPGTRPTWHEVHTTGHPFPIWAQMYLGKCDRTPQHPRCCTAGYTNRARGTGQCTAQWLTQENVPVGGSHTGAPDPCLSPWTSVVVAPAMPGGQSVTLRAITARCIFLSRPLWALT